MQRNSLQEIHASSDLRARISGRHRWDGQQRYETSSRDSAGGSAESSAGFVEERRDPISLLDLNLDLRSRITGLYRYKYPAYGHSSRDCTEPTNDRTDGGEFEGTDCGSRGADSFAKNGKEERAPSGAPIVSGRPLPLFAKGGRGQTRIPYEPTDEPPTKQQCQAGVPLADVQVLCELKPKHLRTPPVVTLSDEEKPPELDTPNTNAVSNQSLRTPSTHQLTSGGSGLGQHQRSVALNLAQGDNDPMAAYLPLRVTTLSAASDGKMGGADIERSQPSHSKRKCMLDYWGLLSPPSEISEDSGLLSPLGEMMPEVCQNTDRTSRETSTQTIGTSILSETSNCSYPDDVEEQLDPDPTMEEDASSGDDVRSGDEDDTLSGYEVVDEEDDENACSGDEEKDDANSGDAAGQDTSHRDGTVDVSSDGENVSSDGDINSKDNEEGVSSRDEEGDFNSADVERELISSDGESEHDTEDEDADTDCQDKVADDCFRDEDQSDICSDADTDCRDEVGPVRARDAKDESPHCSGSSDAIRDTPSAGVGSAAYQQELYAERQQQKETADVDDADVLITDVDTEELREFDEQLRREQLEKIKKRTITYHTPPSEQTPSPDQTPGRLQCERLTSLQSTTPNDHDYQNTTPPSYQPLMVTVPNAAHTLRSGSGLVGWPVAAADSLFPQLLNDETLACSSRERKQGQQTKAALPSLLSLPTQAYAPLAIKLDNVASVVKSGACAAANGVGKIKRKGRRQRKSSSLQGRTVAAYPRRMVVTVQNQTRRTGRLKKAGKISSGQRSLPTVANAVREQRQHLVCPEKPSMPPVEEHCQVRGNSTAECGAKGWQSLIEREWAKLSERDKAQTQRLAELSGDAGYMGQ